MNSKPKSYVVSHHEVQKTARFYAGGKELKLGDVVYFGFVMNSTDEDGVSMSMFEFVMDQETGFLYQLYSNK